MNDTITTLDASGLKCPLPVLKARKAIKALTVGDTIRVISTDPASDLDFKHYRNTSGNTLVDTEREGEGDAARFVFTILKAAG